MSKDKEEHSKTLVQEHALKRLDKVEENQRKAYEKKKDSFSWKNVVMIVCFAAIVGLMLIQMFQR